MATLRSRDEGGRFVGDADIWARIVGPIARYVDIVDVEARYRDHAPFIKSQGGVQILASLHTNEMPTQPELGRIEEMLRSYGDIPKIVVRPKPGKTSSNSSSSPTRPRNPSARVSWAPSSATPAQSCPSSGRSSPSAMPAPDGRGGAVPHTGDAAACGSAEVRGGRPGGGGGVGF
ncbi:type I 3-dehydroquinate dehydratase [Methanoculleus chikugoensis]|uniref:type I 3-dehydroquinate dehydratase n=1 Tax=Methanoculleus chikugoensis TaxID=118126 RepID=UPI001FB40A27|nr:type I 3-dehydroquinate dehydratase [Methanoculleus chikugoensis]